MHAGQVRGWTICLPGYHKFSTEKQLGLVGWLKHNEFSSVLKKLQEEKIRTDMEILSGKFISSCCGKSFLSS
jgi:hypothetical protein